MRKIFASKEMTKMAKLSSNKRVEVYSFFPVDRANCECQEMIKQWKNELALLPESKRNAKIKETGFLVCPHDKAGMKRYEVSCKNCGEVMGYCWASDSSLTDWCDFHYVEWTNGKQWYGCLTPHVSPITEQLCLECCCGEDTRDFRANVALSPKVAYEIELQNSEGREFGKRNSKFRIRQVEENMLPF
jgi:hypothetical protein